MRVTILGCGGSLGVPMVGNHWGRCDPAEPRNRRLRPSILVATESTTVLVDASSDCRAQLLAAAVERIDAVLFTHAHADHVHGIDDLRALTFRRQQPIPAYADEPTSRDLIERFGYALDGADVDRGSYRPILNLRRIDGPFAVGDLPVVQPFVQRHGPGTSLGFRLGAFAYSTDVVDLDEAAFAALDGLDTWVVDACRDEPHPSHAHVAKALEWIARVKPRRAFLTHMNHTLDYASLRAALPPGIEPAYDGLVIDL